MAWGHLWGISTVSGQLYFDIVFQTTAHIGWFQAIPPIKLHVGGIFMKDAIDTLVRISMGSGVCICVLAGVANKGVIKFYIIRPY